MSADVYAADGLTRDEAQVSDSLVAAFEAYADLPVQHEDEPGEFRYHVHMLQGLLAMRIARREYPRGWSSSDDKPSGVDLPLPPPDIPLVNY
jgi:hypothetical protein